MVLQQSLGIQQSLGKTSETWWADQILQVWKIRMVKGYELCDELGKRQVRESGCPKADISPRSG